MGNDKRGGAALVLKRGPIRALIFLPLLLAACGSSAAQVTVDHRSLEVGSSPIDFTAATLDGRILSLHSLEGKPILLNFWATWCANCRSEMPAIQSVLTRYQASGLEVVGINFRESDVSAQQKFLRQVGARFPSVLDPDGKIADAYEVNLGLPVSVFINRKGIVSFLQVGPMAPDFIEEHVRAIL